MTPWTTAGRAVAAEFARLAGERFGDRVLRIVLFGSVARGADGPESDVDLLVVAEDVRADLRDGLDALAFDLTMEARRAVVFVLYPSSLYEVARTRGSEFLAAVEREGEVVWTRSEQRSSAPA